MMFCTARARLSVPPPGPAVATNSIGFCGCQAAAAELAPASTAAVTNSRTGVMVRIISSVWILCFLFVLSSGELFCALHRCRDDRAFLFQRFDLSLIKPVLRQHFARVL